MAPQESTHRCHRSKTWWAHQLRSPPTTFRRRRTACTLLLLPSRLFRPRCRRRRRAPATRRHRSRQLETHRRRRRPCAAAIDRAGNGKPADSNDDAAGAGGEGGGGVVRGEPDGGERGGADGDGLRVRVGRGLRHGGGAWGAVLPAGHAHGARLLRIQQLLAAHQGRRRHVRLRRRRHAHHQGSQ